MSVLNIRIDKCSNGGWYRDRIGQILPVEWAEHLHNESQGIPGDVYWCREGGTYNCINYVLQSDATVVDATLQQIVDAYIAHASPEQVRADYKGATGDNLPDLTCPYPHMNKHEPTMTEQLAAMTKARDEAHARIDEMKDELCEMGIRLLNWIESPQGERYIKAEQYDATNRYADRMEKQLDECQNELARTQSRLEKSEEQLKDTLTQLYGLQAATTANVTINSEPHIVPRHFTYEALVAIVYPKWPDSTPSAVYFCKSPRKEGTLCRGESVCVEEGMHFTCVHTGNA